MPNIEIREKDNLKCVFIFDSYKKSDFNADMEVIKKYQQKQGIPSDAEERSRELDFRFYKGKIPEISYEYFKSACVQHFSKIFFYMMSHPSNKSLILSSELNLQLNVMKSPAREWYFDENSEYMPSDAENACYDVAGTWLIQNIVLPAALGRAEFTTIQRFIIHELVIYVDKVKGHYLLDVTNRLGHYAEKFSALTKKKSAYFLNCLYTSLFFLRQEGFADFYARKDTGRFDMNIDAVKTYNANLLKLSFMRKKAEAEKFYVNMIGWNNLTASSDFVMGRNMCVTIALAISKRMNKIYSITIGNKKIYSNEITSLDEILSNNHLIYIADIDPEAITAAITEIRPTVHYTFIQLYERACKELGISEKNMIMTRRRFYKIITDSIDRLKKEKIARLNSKGFQYLEKDIKPNGN